MRLALLPLLAAGLAQAGIQDLSFHSERNRRDVAIKVYTPPGYEQGRERYPVVYNLHGGGGSPERQWDRTRETLLEAMDKGRVRPMIYVYANGLGDTLFLDYADNSLQVESMIVKELVPFIDRTYRTIASHEGRAIEGFSMGGFGSLLIAFRYPHLFSSVVSYGGAMLSPEMIRIGGENGQFPTADYVKANSPWHLLDSNKDRIKEHLRIRMVCGDKDEKWYPGNVKLKEHADALKVPVEWVSVLDVAHDTKGLYQRVGLESLKFIEAGFAPKLSRAEGVIQDLWYRSALNGRDVLVKVYTPPGYETGTQRYPVVYNLHGAGGGSPQRQWSRTRIPLKEAVETGQVRPLIYVFVDGLGDTFFLDYADNSVKVESMIVQELIPFIDRIYRTIAAREGRGIDGFSMGGGGSLRIALKHPELFSSVVSYGAALIRHDTPKPGDRRFGTQENLDRNNPWTIVARDADKIRGRLRIRMVCGELDGADRGEGGLYKLNIAFKDLLGQQRIPVEWVPVPGVAHDTKGLFARQGVESIRFMQAGFSDAGPAAQGLPEGTRVERDIVYAKTPQKELRLDLYRPATAAGVLPVVLWVHGGAWRVGNKDKPFAARLAGRGYAVASINYRLSQEATFPAQIHDAKAAVRWLRAHARQYGLDADRIAAWGASAGGHLVALLGTSGGVKELEGDLGNPGVSSRVAAVINFYGPSDLLQMNAQGSSQDHDAADSPESQLIGAPIQQNKDKAARANPITYVSKDDAPMLLVHGDRDRLVPTGQSDLLHTALRKAGVASSVHIIPGAGHGFRGGPEIDPLVDEFLDKHLQPARGAGHGPAPLRYSPRQLDRMLNTC